MSYLRRGCVFFNFGGACVTRLFTALHSLRRYYDGDCTVMLATGDAYNQAAEQDLAEYAQIQWFDMERLSKRNLKCVLKPQLFRQSPYRSTLMLDGDLLFQASPEPLLIQLEKGPGFMLTQFCAWRADGPRMQARIQRAKEVVPEQHWPLVNSPVPAVNIGVMGWRNDCQTIDAWEEATKKLAGIHMADEIAAQVTYPWSPHELVGQEWNQSCVYSDNPLPEAKVLHYHGGKEASWERPSSRLWLAGFRDWLFNGKSRNAFDYIQWGSDSLHETLKQHPELLNPMYEFKP